MQSSKRVSVQREAQNDCGAYKLRFRLRQRCAEARREVVHLLWRKSHQEALVIGTFSYLLMGYI
jgi:hypothetical protein